MILPYWPIRCARLAGRALRPLARAAVVAAPAAVVPAPAQPPAPPQHVVRPAHRPHPPYAWRCWKVAGRALASRPGWESGGWAAPAPGDSFAPGRGLAAGNTLVPNVLYPGLPGVPGTISGAPSAPDLLTSGLGLLMTADAPGPVLVIGPPLFGLPVDVTPAGGAQPVPEPPALVLLGVGLSALAMARRSRA